MKETSSSTQLFEQDPGTCSECNEPFEHVRPGKTQATCDCQDKCEDCGMKRAHYAPGEIAAQRSGFLCANCDSDEDIRVQLVREGKIPDNVGPPRQQAAKNGPLAQLVRAPDF